MLTIWSSTRITLVNPHILKQLQHFHDMKNLAFSAKICYRLVNTHNLCGQSFRNKRIEWSYKNYIAFKYYMQKWRKRPESTCFYFRFLFSIHVVWVLVFLLVQANLETISILLMWKSASKYMLKNLRHLTNSNMY